MSSEEFEKLHEIYRSLYDELKLMPERAVGCHGGKHFTLLSHVNVKMTDKHCRGCFFCIRRGEEEAGESLRREAGGGGGSGELPCLGVFVLLLVHAKKKMAYFDLPV